MYFCRSVSQSKMLFLGGVLETYEKLIEHMLNQLPTPTPLITQNKEKPSSSITAISRTSGDETAGDIRSKLAYILGKVQELKKHRYQEQMKVLHGLQNLRHIKVRRLLTQWTLLKIKSGKLHRSIGGILAETEGVLCWDLWNVDLRLTQSHTVRKDSSGN